MLAFCILLEEVGCLVSLAVYCETAQHWSLAHIYITIDCEVSNVSVLTESKVLELNLTVGTVYVECQILTTCFYDRYVVDYYPVIIAVALYGYFDTTIAAGSSLVQCYLGDACQWRGYCAWFSCCVLVWILSCNHISSTVRELSLISRRVNTHSVECKGKCLLAVKGFEIYLYICSFCVVYFLPVGEVGSVECLLLNGTNLNHLYIIKVATTSCHNLNIALSHFCCSSFVVSCVFCCSYTTDGIVVVAMATGYSDDVLC